MMKNACFFLLALFLSFASFGQKVKLKKTTIDKEITLSVPTDFITMAEQDVNTKFVSNRKPLAVYTNFDRTIDVSINLNPTSWRDGHIGLAKDFYYNTILSLYDKVDFTLNEVRNIEGRDYAVFEFVSTIKGEDESITRKANVVNYTYIQYTIKDGHTYVFSFSCPIYLKEKWKKTAGKIMASVILK